MNEVKAEKTDCNAVNGGVAGGIIGLMAGFLLGFAGGITADIIADKINDKRLSHNYDVCEWQIKQNKIRKEKARRKVLIPKIIRGLRVREENGETGIGKMERIALEKANAAEK